MPNHINDIAGRRFGLLVAVSRQTPAPGVPRPKWLCHCDCGASILVRGDVLLSGASRSCGCASRSFRAEASANTRLPLAMRFYRNVLIQDGCWDWKNLNTDTYPRLGAGGRRGSMVGAHRISWEIHRGPIPQGLLVLHLCDNKRCTNPDHLYLGTPSDNMRDVWERNPNIDRLLAGARCAHEVKRARQYCKSGHPFSEENTFIDRRGARVCLTCRRKSSLASYHRRKAACASTEEQRHAD